MPYRVNAYKPLKTRKFIVELAASSQRFNKKPEENAKEIQEAVKAQLNWEIGIEPLKERSPKPHAERLADLLLLNKETVAELLEYPTTWTELAGQALKNMDENYMAQLIREIAYLLEE